MRCCSVENCGQDISLNPEGCLGVFRDWCVPVPSGTVSFIVSINYFSKQNYHRHISCMSYMYMCMCIRACYMLLKLSCIPFKKMNRTCRWSQYCTWSWLAGALPRWCNARMPRRHTTRCAPAASRRQLDMQYPTGQRFGINRHGLQFSRSWKARLRCMK